VAAMLLDAMLFSSSLLLLCILSSMFNGE
jgi:hypothetical protein